LLSSLSNCNHSCGCCGTAGNTMRPSMADVIYHQVIQYSTVLNMTS